MKKNMPGSPASWKTVLLLMFFMSVFIRVSGQSDYQSFYEQSVRINITGMYILGGWALINISSGAYGWATTTGDRMYFNQMNLFWNIVNLSIAGFALYSNYHSDLSQLSSDALLAKQLKTERLFLINGLLDLGYIGTGFLLRHFSYTSASRSAMLKGYGNSIILQGSFLLVFDAVMYGILRTERLDFLHNISLAATSELIEFRLAMPF